jgi:P27 family predicted phage terminase small subunit
MTPPEHLGTAGRRLWRELHAEHTFAEHERELVRRACEAADRADQAREIVEREGVVAVDRYGQTRVHPAVVVEKDSRAAIARLLSALRLGR